jgi:PAS domain S-box-containing protein
MIGDGRNGLGRRVLILAPIGRDAALTRTVLENAGFDCYVSRDGLSLCRDVEQGAGCVLVAEEAITNGLRHTLARIIASQPPWSDLPVVVLTRPESTSGVVPAALETLGNVTLLDRPVRVATLVSAVRVALRARERQFELRDRFESKELLASIVMSSDDAIISKSLDGIILTWNAGAERLFGYAADEVIGKPITIIVPPERLQEERMIIQRLRRGERLEHFETQRLTRDGRYIDISATISPIRSASNRIIAASSVARDVTTQKKAEQALRDADRRKDEFLATLAHELRNPLAPIHSSLQVLALRGTHDPQLQSVQAMLERQVNHMIRLVDDLLEVSRITRGKIVLRTELVDLAATIHSALESSRPLIDAARHRLVMQLPDEPLQLLADPVRMAQVFTNLLNNAAKYTPEGGTIWLAARREGDEAVVTIRDTGIGILPEMLPRIFEIFTQVDISHRRSQTGLGIGLTLVRSLVEMHGGTVSARSEGAGRGSEFTIRLPLALNQVRQEQPAAAARPPVGDLSVLVVDDNRDAADSLGTLLRAMGARATVVHDGGAALERLETLHPDLVLLDLGMPGLDGYEVAQRIRQQPRNDDITLVALTGWGQEEDRRRSRAAGFDHHLIKPADATQLHNLMSSVWLGQRGLPINSGSHFH